MSYMYLLAGENFELAEAELNGFLKSQGLEEKAFRNGRLAETSAEPSQLKRLSMVHEVSRKICEIDDLDSEISFRPEGSYAVRAEVLTGDRNREKVEEVLGDKFSSEDNSVDLENPEKTIKAYVTEEKIFLGEVIQDINRGLFKNRKNDNRAFSSPVSLDPVLARTLVNLSGLKPGEFVLDPFCGTGGILIEAGLCGIGVKGFDIQEEMVKGTKKNLEEYGIINYSISRKDFSEVGEIVADALITDLPYGKASKKTEGLIKDFISFIEDFDGRAVFMYDSEVIGDYEADFSIYVHGSLTRHIFVVD